MVGFQCKLFKPVFASGILLFAALSRLVQTSMIFQRELHIGRNETSQLDLPGLLANRVLTPRLISAPRQADDCAWQDHALAALYPEVNGSLPQTTACRRMMTHLTDAERACQTKNPVKVVFSRGIALGAFRHRSLAPGDNDVDAFVLYKSERDRASAVQCFLRALASVHPHVHNWNEQYQYYGIESRAGTCNADLFFEVEGKNTRSEDICFAQIYGTRYKFRNDVPVGLERFYGKSVYFLLPTHLKMKSASATCAHILSTTDEDGDGHISEPEVIKHYRVHGMPDAAGRVATSAILDSLTVAVNSFCNASSSTDRLH